MDNEIFLKENLDLLELGLTKLNLEIEGDQHIKYYIWNLIEQSLQRKYPNNFSIQEDINEVLEKPIGESLELLLYIGNNFKKLETDHIVKKLIQKNHFFYYSLIKKFSYSYSCALTAMTISPLAVIDIEKSYKEWRDIKIRLANETDFEISGNKESVSNLSELLINYLQTYKVFGAEDEEDKTWINDFFEHMKSKIDRYIETNEFTDEDGNSNE